MVNPTDSLSLNGERMGLIRRISIRFGGSRPRELERFLKFLVVGAMGAAIDLGLTNLFMRFIFRVQEGQLLPVVIAAIIGFTVAVSSNFIWNRYWTYPDSRSRRIRHQLAQFFLVSLVGLAVRAGVVAIFSPIFSDLVTRLVDAHFLHLNISNNELWKLGANLAVIMALILVAMWNFFANRYWTYNDVE
ncbi:MAG: hypothetical protein OHK0023_24300 [Anaerolineae bacterium]